MELISPLKKRKLAFSPCMTSTRTSQNAKIIHQSTTHSEYIPNQGTDSVAREIQCNPDEETESCKHIEDGDVMQETSSSLNNSSEIFMLLKSLSYEELMSEMVDIAEAQPLITAHLRRTYGHRVIRAPLSASASSSSSSSLHYPYPFSMDSDCEDFDDSYTTDIDQNTVQQYYGDCKDKSEKLSSDELFIQDHCFFPFSAYMRVNHRPVLVERTCGMDDDTQSVLIRVKDKQSNKTFTCSLSDTYMSTLSREVNNDRRSRRRRRNAKILQIAQA